MCLQTHTSVLAAGRSVQCSLFLPFQIRSAFVEVIARVLSTNSVVVDDAAVHGIAELGNELGKCNNARAAVSLAFSP